MNTRTILLVDSNEQSALEIQRFLKVSAFAFTTSHALDIAESLNYLKTRKADVLLLDAELLKSKDFSALKLVATKAAIPLILLSDSSLAETKNRAEAIGATDYLLKNKINLFHLQKSITSALKISEVETKMDSTLHEFVAQQDTLHKLLNKIDSGVLVLNTQNVIRFANAKAYNVLAEEAFSKHIANYISYSEIEGEEQNELKPNPELTLHVKITPLNWNGEKANLFILDSTKKTALAPHAFLSDSTLNTVLNSITDNVLLLQGDFIVLANKPALSYLQYKETDLKLKPLRHIFESQEATDSVSIQSFLADKQSTGFMLLADGSQQAVRFKIKPITLANDFFQLLTFTVIESKAEVIPVHRTDENQLSAEGVLLLASHDLREPVRTILNYTQLIADNLNKGKVNEAIEYANIAKAAADRMEKLLSDLKTHIALSEHTFHLSKVSMKLSLNDVLKQLKHKIEITGAEINFTTLPDVSADRELVEKLLYHLIDNAIKFQKAGKKPVIDIGFDKFEGNLIFCVRDNGIGISKKYYAKVFELFERLNRIDDYTGNGLGLAICKKIVEMHGGEIWIESLPGAGSNFYFTLMGK